MRSRLACTVAQTVRDQNSDAPFVTGGGIHARITVPPRADSGGVAFEQRMLGFCIDKWPWFVQSRAAAACLHNRARASVFLPLAERDFDSLRPTGAELRLQAATQLADYLGGPGSVDRRSHRGFVVQSRHIADAHGCDGEHGTRNGRNPGRPLPAAYATLRRACGLVRRHLPEFGRHSARIVWRGVSPGSICPRRSRRLWQRHSRQAAPNLHLRARAVRS